MLSPAPPHCPAKLRHHLSGQDCAGFAKLLQFGCSPKASAAELPDLSEILRSGYYPNAIQHPLSGCRGQEQRQ